jgi:hypothetical protein
VTVQDDVARRQYRRQQALAAAAAQQAQQAWQQIDPQQIAGSWRSLLALLLRFLTGFQAEAARSGVTYVTDALAAAGVAADPIGVVVPESLAGVASDGRDLESLLQTPLIGVFDGIKTGTPAERALQAGAADLVKIVSTQIADAGRVATGLAMSNDRGVRGYVRIVNLPACGRCIILAGREYSHSTGFQRHPQCDCQMRPLTAEEWDSPVAGTDPRALFERMSPQQQAKAFTVHGAQAIRDGADISRVVNARRGMATAGGRRFTSEATTRRATGRTRYGGRARVMPETIYAEAQRLDWDRDRIVAALKANGFIY